jgi:ATP-dependent Clp protease ATP-binding subunit ClpC
MFERFTDRARRVVVLAQLAARELGHNHIGSEHILLGLLREGDGIAAQALGALGVTADAARDEVESIISRGSEAPSEHLPFTPRAKKVLELSLRESLSLGQDYIGTEHILLGLIREGEGVANHVLTDLGAGGSQVREKVVELLAGAAQAAPPHGPRPQPAEPDLRRLDEVLSRLTAIDAVMAANERRLTLISERLAAIERHLGLGEPPAAGP